jgi:hypothetical protein
MSDISLRAAAPNESDALMDSMRANFCNQNDAKVGIFWYDAEANELFGIHSIQADELSFDGNGRKTVRALHKTVWQKEKNKAEAKGIDSIYQGDYTQVPRGRVWQRETDGAFYVTIGKWINEYPQAKGLIAEEFDLPDSTEFVYDRHWDIGHGWNE